MSRNLFGNVEGNLWTGFEPDSSRMPTAPQRRAVSHAVPSVSCVNILLKRSFENTSAFLDPETAAGQ